MIKSLPIIFRPPCVIVEKTGLTCIRRLSAYNVPKRVIGWIVILDIHAFIWYNNHENSTWILKGIYMARVNEHLNRRDILRSFGLGALGLTLGGGSFGTALVRAASGSPLVGKGQLYKKTAGPAKVGLVKGNDCRDIVYQALKKMVQLRKSWWGMNKK
jgi:hypothetical protein